MNIKNLKLLADYLSQLPADYQHFDMFDFHSLSARPFAVDEVSCGTVACAIGHAPYVEGLPKPEYGERWHTYSDRLFDLEPDSWTWCFAERWKFIDNTPQGAAKRIHWLLEHGVTDDVEEVLAGRQLPDYIAEIGVNDENIG